MSTTPLLAQAQTFVQTGLFLKTDSIKPNFLASNESRFNTTESNDNLTPHTFPSIQEITSKRTAAVVDLGYSKSGNPVTAYYFPGKSERKALIIGGVHGSELSAIDIARKMVGRLTNNETPFYSVIVVPLVFPDNEAIAIQQPDGLKKKYNSGRYTNKEAADPNRQMPQLGKAFSKEYPFDVMGREIEHENQLLLQLIETFRPHRILNLHAIRDINRAGIYADPRTDENGIALGFASDSSLAIQMATFIYENGGNVAGNRFDSFPSALYYTDPPIVPRGNYQQRNLLGSNLPSSRGQGVSLGSWAATTVCDASDSLKSRPAMRLITIEFPGYKKPADYKDPIQQEYYSRLSDLYASAISRFFLGEYFMEDFPAANCAPKPSPSIVTDIK